MNNSECEYLKKLLAEVQYDIDLFTIWTSEEKYIMGFTTGKNKQQTPISRVLKFNTIYQSLIDLDLKIKMSCHAAIELAYSESLQENFSIVGPNTEEETWAYYYIENALYRTVSLWDMLAQLYCMYYKVRGKQNKIEYKKIFKENAPHAKKFKEKANNIQNYLKEKDNREVEERWSGNHSFVNEARNKLVHRNSPNIAVISDYDINLKHHPSYILKRIIEDYYVASDFLKEILDEISKGLQKE